MSVDGIVARLERLRTRQHENTHQMLVQKVISLAVASCGDADSISKRKDGLCELVASVLVRSHPDFPEQCEDDFCEPLLEFLSLLPVPCIAQALSGCLYHECEAYVHVIRELLKGSTDLARAYVIEALEEEERELGSGK